MEFPINKLAMKLFSNPRVSCGGGFFFNLTPDEDQVAPPQKVAHFHCSEMTENTLYDLNQLRL